MSIITVDRAYFWIYLLNHNSLTHQTWSINRYKHRQYFVWRTGAKFQVLFSFVTCTSYSITNYFKFPVFHFLELLNSFFFQLLDIDRSHYIVIPLKLLRGLELVSSLQHWAKSMLEIFVTHHTSIWPILILIVLRIQKK